MTQERSEEETLDSSCEPVEMGVTVNYTAASQDTLINRDLIFAILSQLTVQGI